MAKIMRFWKIILLDTLGVLLMIAAILTGWLPGPTGIPLFILGLSLLAIHHDWAKRYIDLVKKYADRLGDLVFINRPAVQLLYDMIAPILIISGLAALYRHSALWMISAGVFALFTGLTLFLGNRHRWKRIRQMVKGK